MRILIHDYSGHPFQIELSRELAARGHIVRHLYCASFETPRGALERLPHDPPGLEIRPITLNSPVLKHALLRRREQDISVGLLVAREIAGFAPEVVMSTNAPLDTQRKTLAATHRISARFVFWLQDIYSEAISRLISRRQPWLGGLAGRVYRQIEFSMLRASDHIVAISGDFLPMLAAQNVPRDRISVIENWAPLAGMRPAPRDNALANAAMPQKGPRIVYSGTLGRKHDPTLLLALARLDLGHVHVFSQGHIAGRLRDTACSEGIANLHVRDWVPFQHLAAILSGADILLAMIDEDAGMFCVPSKVLTYLCVGRPMVGFIPEGNLARTTIMRAEAGLVGDPGGLDAMAPQIASLLADEGLRRQLGGNARAYAEKTFDIAAIADRFERILAGQR